MTTTTIPADRCYWAILAPLDGTRRPTRTQLEYQFETYLPCPIAEVQCAFAPLPDGRTLACAIDHATLAPHIDRHPDAIRITPDTVPAPLGVETANPDALNFRTGAFEPPAIARHRSALAVHVALVALLITGAIVLSLHQRTATADSAFSRATVALDAERRRVLGGSPTSTQDPTLLMMAELDTLRRTRSSNTPGAEFAVTPHLAALFDAWPADLPTRTESVIISDSTITVAALVEANEGAESLRESLASVEGWQLAQPRLNRQRDAVRVNLRMSRTGDSP